ncbi:unnamed protein product, partial [Prorocentrum cordatum]
MEGGGGWAAAAADADAAAAAASDAAAASWADAAAQAAEALAGGGWAALAADAAAVADDGLEAAPLAPADGGDEGGPPPPQRDVYGHGLDVEELKAPAAATGARRKATWLPLAPLRKKLKGAEVLPAGGAGPAALPAVAIAAAAAAAADVDEEAAALFGDWTDDGDAVEPAPEEDAQIVPFDAAEPMPDGIGARRDADDADDAGHRHGVVATIVGQMAAIMRSKMTHRAVEVECPKQRGMLNYWLYLKGSTLPFSQECALLKGRGCHLMAKQLCEGVQSRGGRLISWTECLRYDETPMHMRLSGQVGTVVLSSSCKSAHVAKILNTERVYAMLVWFLEVGYYGVRIPLETPVQSVSRTTGEVLGDAIMASQPPMKEVPEMFDRRQRLVCTDGASGISRLERNLERVSDGSSSTLRTKCEVHMVHKWFKSCFHHVACDTSCMVNAAKALRWHDGMRSFRATLRNVVESSLVHYPDEKPSAVNTAYSTKVLDLFMAEKSARNRIRRCVILSLASGD